MRTKHESFNWTIEYMIFSCTCSKSFKICFFFNKKHLGKTKYFDFLYLAKNFKILVISHEKVKKTGNLKS